MEAKEIVLKNINAARESHLAQMTKLDLLINGSKVENPTPVSKDKCVFGKWFYSGDHLKEYFGLQLYEKIDLLHTSWHAQYAKIYEIFYEKKGGLMSKIFSSKPSQMDIDKANAYYDELKHITDDLLNTLKTCERRINALSDEKFH